MLSGPLRGAKLPTPPPGNGSTARSEQTLLQAVEGCGALFDLMQANSHPNPSPSPTPTPTPTPNPTPKVDGEEVLALSSLGNETGARSPESSALSTMRILIDGNEPPAHFRGQYVQGASKVWVQARTLPLRKVGGVPAEEVFIRTPSNPSP